MLTKPGAVWTAASAAAVISLGCLGIQSALGFRARRAVLENRFEAFDDLMKEASEATPTGPLDNPTKTVLTHFLDFAGDPRFLTRIADYRASGWIPDEMFCAIRRAHFAAVQSHDPEAAWVSAQLCFKRARKAATEPDRGWEVEACLAEAPFLIQTSTAVAGVWLAHAAHPAEPEVLRLALLDGLTRVDLSGPPVRWGVDPPSSGETRRAWLVKQAQRQTDRLRWVFTELQERNVPVPFAAAATARGVLEIESILAGLGDSFIADYAAHPDTYPQQLAWAWTAAMKRRPPHPSIEPLGVWDRHREPPGPAFWYVCRPDSRLFREPSRTESREPIPITSVRLAERAPRHHVHTTFCPATSISNILGPFPLEIIATTAMRRALADAGAPRPIQVRIHTRRVADL